jgi:predicted SPOUT superfamily RNA methylase MTH1
VHLLRMHQETALASNCTKSEQKGRSWTLAVALPGSVLANAQTPALQTYLAGQIARALAIFEVDEVIIFAERVRATIAGTVSSPSSTAFDTHLARLLQYAECPQYLRQALFPHTPELQYVGLLNPLDTPHHPRRHEGTPYREGVVVPAPDTGATSDRSRYVHVGWDAPVAVDTDMPLPVGQRVTVRFEKLERSGHYVAEQGSNRKRKRDSHPSLHMQGCWTWTRAVMVARDEPRERLGLYWGYKVRLAANLVQALSTSGADVKIGTSERGTDLFATLWGSSAERATDSTAAETEIDGASARRASFIPPGGFRKLLIAFGGIHGLEASYGSPDVAKLFDAYVNACPHQGSRTIRTEEALLVVLSAMHPWIRQYGRKSAEQIRASCRA